MKTIKLTILLLIAPLTFYAQSLTGLWIGTLSNDSNTIRRDQSFEIVLTQYKDKVYGYSRMTFFVHDTLYYIVKRVKGTVEADVCEVKDDDIISHNFPRKPDKGVKLISTFRRNQHDSIWHLDGDWKTTETKKHGYYSISGKIALETETDIEKSKLMPHLEELKLTDDIVFYQEAKKAEQTAAVINQQKAGIKKEEFAKAAKPSVVSAREINKEKITKVPVKKEPEIIAQPVKDNSKDIAVKEEKAAPLIPKGTKKEDIVKTPVKTEPVIVKKEPVTENKKQDTVKEDKPAVVAVSVKKKEEENTPVKKETKTAEPVAIAKPAEQKKEVSTEPVKTEIKKTETATVVIDNKEKLPSIVKPLEAKPFVAGAAALVAERSIAAPQIVFFRSDSLELSLYDNGEVDGDTVSVLLNGELILAKQGLKATAIKKTIYVPAGKTDSLTLVLYAENLGKYPPNTGLLVIHDGDDVYQVRFSADLLQNAAVIFQRKRP
ncbi:MAG: hypothetical protein WDO71_07445 [Bacteroidota bacterium]